MPMCRATCRPSATCSTCFNSIITVAEEAGQCLRHAACVGNVRHRAPAGLAPAGAPPMAAGSGRIAAPDQQIPREHLNDLVTLVQRRALERRHAPIRTRTGWLDLEDFSLHP